MPPNGDFQHQPSWRELVVATALSLRRHHAETLIVPMSLIRDAYRAEILGGLADAGEEVLPRSTAASCSFSGEHHTRPAGPRLHSQDAARIF